MSIECLWSASALPYEELLALIQNFGNLVALGVGEPLTPLEIFGTCNGREPSGAERSVRIKLIHNREPIASAPRNVPHWDMLFTLPDVRERFGEFVSAWFSRDAAGAGCFAGEIDVPMPAILKEDVAQSGQIAQCDWSASYR